MKDNFFPVLRSLCSDVSDPYTEFNKLQNSVDCLFDEFFTGGSIPTFSPIQGSYPKVNVKELVHDT